MAKSKFILTLALATCYAFSVPLKVQASDIMKEDLEKFDNIEFRESLLLQSKDHQTGQISHYPISEDNNIWGLAFHLNPDIKNFMGLTALEIRYSKKTELFWLDFCLTRTQGNYSDFGRQNPYMSGNPDALAASKDTAFFAGLGVSYRFYWIQHLLENIINSNDIFESTHAQVGYLQLQENYYGHKFKGPAIKTDFNIHKRISPKTHLGIKFSYTLGSLKRPRDFTLSDSERSYQRSLNVSWPTFALELGFYL